MAVFFSSSSFFSPSFPSSETQPSFFSFNLYLSLQANLAVSTPHFPAVFYGQALTPSAQAKQMNGAVAEALASSFFLLLPVLKCTYLGNYQNIFFVQCCLTP